MGEDLRESWNKIMQAMLVVEKLWKKHQEALMSVPRSEREVSYKGLEMKKFQLFERAAFDVTLPRMRDYAKQYGGGYEGLLIEIPKKKEEEENG